MSDLFGLEKTSFSHDMAHMVSKIPGKEFVISTHCTGA